MQPSKDILRKETHLSDYLVILDRRKWIIITAIVVTMAAAFLYIRLRGKEPNIYKAQVKVLIEPRDMQDMVFYRSVQDISLDMSTQMELIKTTPVIVSVVKKLELTKYPEGTPEFMYATKQLQASIDIKFAESLDKSVRNPYILNRIIIISVIDLDPYKAQKLANAVAQAYIDYDRLSRFQAGQDAIRWLTDQLADLKIKLQTSESSFQDFKSREGIVTLDSKRTEELTQISQLSSNYMDIRLNLVKIETIINKTESDKNSDLNIPVALLNNDTLKQLGNQLSSQEAELDSKRKQGFTDKYPEVIKLKNSIQSTKHGILAELKQQRDFLRAQEKSFLIQQETQRQEALKLNAKELQYLNLEREVRTNQELYNTLLTKAKELSLISDADLNKIRIIEPAELPMFPMKSSSRDPKLIMILAAIMGIFLGIAYSFLLERFENSIRTPEDIAYYLGLPVLGIVPRMPKTKKDKPSLIVVANPKSAPAESYRSLRTSLLYSDTNPMKTILITSAGPGEGKSITTANLGLALAKSNKNVLIVDADLRRPMMHNLFGLNRNAGLSSVLEGEASLESVIVKINEIDLSILPSGRLPKEPAEILGSEKMKDFIAKVSNIYDIVLFDSAPILGMTDTMVLAKEVDKTIMIIKVGQVSRKALRMAISSLDQLGVQIYGSVLNNVDVKRDRYYNEYYHYYYSSYEDKEANSKKK